MKEPRVLIVGAGIAGLTLARALTLRGLPFDLIEKVPAPAPVGAGITLTYNALRLLDALGVGRALRSRGQPFDGARIASITGATLQDASLPRVMPGAQSLAIHRAALHGVLSDGLPVQWDRTPAHLQAHPDHVHVTLNTGEARPYALVIGADGLHSTVRAHAAPNAAARYAGYTCWRFVTAAPFTGDPVEWWGDGRRLGLVNVGQGQTYGYATLNLPAGQPDPVTGRAKRLRALYQHFPERARPILNAVQDSEVIHHDLYEHPRHVWHVGRVALIGDAAHAMTPNLGQGAAMGIEDAITLAEALRVHGPTPDALHVYRAIRHARVKGIADASRLIGRVGQLQHPGLRAARDTLLGLMPTPLADQALKFRMFDGAPDPPAY